MLALQAHPVKIFLSGPSGIGKTTIIKKICTNFSSNSIEGCIAQEVCEGDKRVGFEIKYLQSEKVTLLAHASKTLSKSVVGKFSVNIDLLEKELIPYLEKITNDQHAKILCLDEIGRIQVAAKGFLDAVDKIVCANKPLLATIVHDDEIWARKYKDSTKYYYVYVTEANRDQLPALISAILEQEKLILAQNKEVREKILYLFNLYIAQNKMPELLKLFKHTIPYVAKNAVEYLDKVNSYLVHGYHGDYTVTKHDGGYSCTCKFYSEASTTRECSHIQTVWVLEPQPNIHTLSLRPLI